MVINVTGTGVFQPTFVTVFPTSGVVPTASTVNLSTYQTAANLATVRLGANGGVSFANANGSIHLVVDLLGYYAPGPEGTSTYQPIAPNRIADSRLHEGFEHFDRAPGPVAGRRGRCDTGSRQHASAVVVNLTAVNGSAPTFLTAYPKGGTTPTASNLNLLGREIRANLAVVKVGDDHSISVFNDSGGADVVIDVVGYFVDDDSGSTFVSLPPTRLVDTRSSGHIGPLHPFAPSETQSLTMAAGMVPTDATAVVFNLTVLSPNTGTFMTAYPATVPDADPPIASNVNAPPNLIDPNLVVAKVGANGMVSLFNKLGTTNVVIDLVGYYR